MQKKNIKLLKVGLDKTMTATDSECICESIQLFDLYFHHYLHQAIRAPQSGSGSDFTQHPVAHVHIATAIWLEDAEHPLLMAFFQPWLLARRIHQS